MLGSVGIPEMALILLIALLLFGANRLPEIGRSIGKGLAEFKKSLREITEDMTGEESSGRGDTPDPSKASDRSPPE